MSMQIAPVLSKNSIDPQNRGCLPVKGWAWSGARHPMNDASGSLSTMVQLSPPLRVMLVALAGWVNQQQREVIDYLQEENRALREQLRPGRLRFTDDQRRRLAVKAKILGRRVLRHIATIVTPDSCWPGIVEVSGGLVVPGRPRSPA
jgi:hypothetical protein